MFTSTNPDLPENSLHIKQDDKFFSKLLTREASNPSFRVYNGGVGGSVPFMWESRPGTPKYKLCDSSTLAPLTPPPSYYYFNSNKKPIKKNSRSSLFCSLFPRINLRNRKLNVFSNTLSSSSLSWSSTNSSSSFDLSNSRYCDERSSVSSFSSVADYKDVSTGSPRSLLCFGLNRRFARRFGGCKRG